MSGTAGLRDLAAAQLEPYVLQAAQWGHSLRGFERVLLHLLLRAGCSGVDLNLANQCETVIGAKMKRGQVSTKKRPALFPYLLNAAFLERLVNHLIHAFANLIDAETRGPLARRVLFKRLQEVLAWKIIWPCR